MNTNGAQLHLVLNHLPVVIYPIVALALAWGLVRRESAVVNFGLRLTLLGAIALAAAYLTGDGAEDVLKVLPGFEEALLEAHEDSALISLILGELAGAAALYLIAARKGWLSRFGGDLWQKRVTTALLLLCAALTINLMVTAHRGGLIRHSEIRTLP